jgi:hypothetical protein
LNPYIVQKIAGLGVDITNKQGNTLYMFTFWTRFFLCISPQSLFHYICSQMAFTETHSEASFILICHLLYIGSLRKNEQKNGVFWNVTPFGSCKNRRSRGTWRLLHQGDKNRWTRNNASCN